MFLDSHYGAVLRAIAVVVGDRDAAEDCVQEAFSRACRRWRSVSTMDRPVAWVYTVALNTQRKEWRRADRKLSPGTDGSIAGDLGASVADSVDLNEALRRLAPRQRSVVVLRYLADLSVAETAMAMGCAEGTVKAALHQALRNLRVDLEDRDA